MESELETVATGATYSAIFSGISHIPFGDSSIKAVCMLDQPFHFYLSDLFHFVHVPILTGLLTDEHVFLLSPDSSVHLLVRVQLCDLEAIIFCAPNRVSVELL